MGAVYAAFDAKLERDVALKVLSDDGDLALQKKRLLREARIAAKLTHPNIATVYEVDELEGRLIIVMELLEGSSLRAILKQRKMDLEEALAVARDVARALGRAHAAGVIHRDVKPENIFVTTPSPETLLGKVLDFGLARQRPLAAPPSNQEHTDTTTRGDMWGTPGYVSPEQAHGQPVDVRTDIFSFGVVLYEMLAGIRPFRGDSAIAMLLATTKAEPRPIREILPSLPVDVESIVKRCLAKAREDRFEDGHALAAALEACTRGSTRNAIGSRPSFHFDDDTERASFHPDEAPTTGGSAAIALSTSESAMPPLEQQRSEHMKLVFAIGGGVAFALVLVIVAVAWTTGGPRAAAAPPTSTSAATLAEDPPPPPAVVEPAPTLEPEPAEPALELPDAPPKPVAPAGSVRRKKPVTEDCRVPFTYDRGVKIPKRHCL